MKKQSILIVVSIIIIIASIGTGVFLIVREKEEPEFMIEGINSVENKNILADTSIQGLNITNVSLLTREGTSTFKAKITNTKKEEVNIKNLYVIFSNNDNLTKVPALQNVKISPNTSTYINITSDTDLSKTNKIEYSIEK